MNVRQCLLAAAIGAATLLLSLNGLAAGPDDRADRHERGGKPAFNKSGNELRRQAAIGLRIAPVDLDLERRNRALVGLGSYLVNGPMDCVGCHHADRYLPGGNPFLGEPEAINTATYLGGGVPFGPFVSRNLTPDRDGRPGGLTFEQFRDVLRHGTEFKDLLPDPVLLQVMPWTEYRHATLLTIRALYAYLSAIPCLEGGPGQPVNRCDD